MPKIEVKEEVKTKKKSTAVDKKEKTKKIVDTEKGKAKKTTTKKIPKAEKNETLLEKIVSKAIDIVNVEEKPKSTKVKKVDVKEEKPKATKTKRVATKKATTKKATTKKTTSKKTTSKKSVKKVEEKKTYLPEYYDLPYRYNDTVVKILYQTPKRIFVYWDVSDSDRQRYINAFGEDFFEKTYPVLLVHNEEMNYTFEVQINDFANSWYIDINDPKSKYIVQLGRKFKEIQKEQIDYAVVEEEKINLQNDYIYITHSNKLETPNDKVLFEKVPEKITFRNIKTGEITYKDVKHVLGKISKFYDNPKVEEMYKDIYKEMYGEEILSEEMNIISNPSSGNSSSFFK